MEQKLEIGLVAPRVAMVFLPREPDGVEVSGLSTKPWPICEQILYFTVTVVPGVAKERLSKWLYLRIKNYGSERVTINGKEPKDRSDFDKIVREEIKPATTKRQAHSLAAPTRASRERRDRDSKVSNVWLSSF